MAVAVKKYNPGFLTDDEIIASFCVRTSEFESIIECLGESSATSSIHSLVIGPRGSGKTHLLLRVAAAVRRDAALAGLFPVVFAEESYEVTTCGEFWLECLGRVAEQAPAGERDNLRLTHNDLRTVVDDQALSDRCIGSLLDFADRHEKRLLLLVENLNMLFSDMGDPDAGWRLRKTLQTEPRIILLGSATSRFEEIDSPEHALYDLFRVITLRPLDTAECEVLWTTVSGKPSTTRAVRPLEILTGGNPRLLTIIARFGAGQSFRELMGNLLDLVDEHTEYFKSHLESLPPKERRVYLALARLWKPATAKEVANLARVDVNSCSALLKRLVQRGVVAIEGGTPRRRQYYLTERLYNIYYLLRRGGGADRLVKALIDFMVCLYSPSELWDFVKGISEDPHASDVLVKSVPVQMAKALVKEARMLDQMGRTSEALEIYDNVIHRSGADGAPEIESRVAKEVAMALLDKARLLLNVGRNGESIAACDALVGRFGASTETLFLLTVAAALGIKGLVLSLEGDSPRTLNAFNQALDRIGATGEMTKFNSMVAIILHRKGLEFIKTGQPMEAIAAFDQVVALPSVSEEPHWAGTIADALVSKVIVLDQMDRTISESEFSLLLKCLASADNLRPDGIEALTCFVGRVGPARSLELIQDSPAAGLLLPLVTALQQELGQSTQVAKEIDEVAGDIRRELVELRGRIRSGEPALRGKLTVTDPGA